VLAKASSPSRAFRKSKFVVARRNDLHAGRVCSPIRSARVALEFLPALFAADRGDDDERDKDYERK
jgi:hypothetical protein